MLLDRAFQKQLLQELANAYPEFVHYLGDKQADRKYIVNVWYLDGHGLIRATKQIYADGSAVVAGATITEKGIDFLEDDGGLSAILDTFTVKIHEDTLRQMLEAKIQCSEAAPADKQGLIDALRALPGESIKHLTMKLLDLGLEKAPDMIQLLQTAILSAPK